jgi:hypothetical protein
MTFGTNTIFVTNGIYDKDIQTNNHVGMWSHKMA